MPAEEPTARLAEALRDGLLALFPPDLAGPSLHPPRVCVALSGGMDSMVLLDVARGLAAAGQLRLQAAHVHHGLSVHADAWAEFCLAHCASIGVACEVLPVAVDRQHPGGLEEAARHARHAALAQIDCDALLFAHHAEDQAETLLFRLLRGTHLRGAGAMRALERGMSGPPRLRPWLRMARASLAQHAAEQGLRWVEDESNQSQQHARNYLRHCAFPVLRARWPAGVEALARAAEHFAESADLLDQLAGLDSERVGGQVGGQVSGQVGGQVSGQVSYSRAALMSLPEPRLRNLLAWRVRGAGGYSPQRAQLQDAVRQLCEARSAGFRLPLGDFWLAVYRDRVWLQQDGASGEQITTELEVEVAPQVWQGGTSLLWGAGEIRFERRLGEGLRIPPPLLGQKWGQEPNRGRWTLRPRSAGLRMALHAGGPRRSFKNLCQEAGVPAWLRPRLPVLYWGDEPVWIGGIGLAGAWRVGAGEEGVLPEWLPG